MLALVGLANAQTWVDKANLPEEALPSGARALGMAVLNGKIYTVGGLDWPNPVASVLEYDPFHDRWTRKVDMLEQRYAPAAAVVNDKLYAIGGATDSSQTTTGSVEVYDPISNAWSMKAPMDHPRWAHSAVVLNGRIYAIGGRNKSAEQVPWVEEYDPISDSWRTRANMPAGRVPFGSVALNDKSTSLAVAVLMKYGNTTPTWILGPSNHRSRPPGGHLPQL